MDNTTNTGFFKSTVNYGAIFGAILTVYTFLIFIFKVFPSTMGTQMLLFLIGLTIYFLCIYLFSKQIKKTALNGNMTYMQGLQAGILITFFAAIIVAFYTYIQNVFIDPDYIIKTVEAKKALMANFMSGKVDDAQIEKTLSELDKVVKSYKPLNSFFSEILGNTIGGALISLITAAILRTKINPFNNTLDSQIS